MLNLTNNTVQQVLSAAQSFPSSALLSPTLTKDKLMHYLMDESFELNTLSIEDMLGWGSVNISTLLNEVLSAFVYVGDDMPNFFAAIVVTFIFAKLYAKHSTTMLLQRISVVVQRMLIINVVYFIFYLGIRMFLSILPWYYQTKHWLNPGVRSFFLDDNQVMYNFIIGFVFLAVFAVLHLFINSLVVSNHVSPEVPVLTYLVACFGWTLLEINDFALFIVCLEGFSLTLYILATVGRTYGGVSASIKYFVFGTLGSILLYWGGLNIFELSATMKLDVIKELTDSSISNIVYDSFAYSKLVWAQSFILIGFLIKLGAAPLHQWIADVYAGVPMFVTAFYSTFVKLVLFILFLKFAVSFTSTKEVEYAALLSLIIGCFGTLRQVEIKRFLAYGSITHTGYLLMGDLSATYVYLATYVLASLVFFSVLLNLRLNGQEFIYLSDLRFVGQSLSQTERTILVLTLASMAGLPPFAGFYGKMSVWMSLIEDIYLFNDLWSFILFTTNILTSLIIMFYYMQLMCTLFVNDESVKQNSIVPQTVQCIESIYANNITLKFTQYFGASLLTFWTFVMPAFLTLVQSTF